MKRRDDAGRRTVAGVHGVGRRPVTESRPGYPPLREHLLTRRDALTFVGAALVTGMSPGCVTGDAPNPEYETYRLPGHGDVTVPLTGGGTLRCYFNLVGSWGIFRSDLALARLQDELRTWTYGELAVIYYGGDPEALRALEEDLEASLQDPDFTYELHVQRGSLVITFLELSQ